MRQQEKSWRKWLTGFFGRRDNHHRVCRLCHKPIKKHERWRQVKVGWFAPVYTVEHRNCAQPAEPAQWIPAVPKPNEPELPFEWADETVLHGDVFPVYGAAGKEKVQ